MATHILMNPWHIQNDVFMTGRFAGGPGQKDTTWVEATGQSWNAGDLIYNNGATNLSICTDDGTILTGVIAGQATKKAVGVAGTKTHFRVIRPTDRFIMNVFHGTPSLAVTAITQLAGVFPLRHASSRWMVDIETAGESATTADAVVKVVGFPLWHPLLNVEVVIGDRYGLVEVEFLEFTVSTDPDAAPPLVRRLQMA